MTRALDPERETLTQSVEEIEKAKAAAAWCAAEMVEDGMVVGLGTGSTASLFVEFLARRVTDGLRIVGVSTSSATSMLARELGIPLADLDSHPAIDLDCDGADEIDPNLNLLKGAGGAMLHEKLVAMASSRFAAMADSSKLVESLGERHPIPVEVVTFGWHGTRARLETTGATVSVRGTGDRPQTTDSGNIILDVTLPQGADVFEFADRIKTTTGVVDHGVFRGNATEAIVGYADGSVRTLRRASCR